MNHSTGRKSLGLVALLAVLGLAGCGGGGSAGGGNAGTAVATPATVPASAGESTQSLVDFSKSQSADDTAEPFRIGSFAPPTDDRAEPSAVR